MDQDLDNVLWSILFHIAIALKTPTHFGNLISNSTLKPSGLLVSFDVTSLFTKISILVFYSEQFDFVILIICSLSDVMAKYNWFLHKSHQCTKLRYQIHHRPGVKQFSAISWCIWWWNRLAHKNTSTLFKYWRFW